MTADPSNGIPAAAPGTRPTPSLAAAPGTRPTPSPGADSLGSDLRSAAIDLRPGDPDRAERLDAIASTIDDPLDRRWVGVDVYRVIDPDGAADRIRDLSLGDRRIAMLERTRNVLVLVPIFVTWLGLLLAALAYPAAIRADPGLVARPFLLLWEEGFGGHATGIAGLSAVLTLSRVALIDLIVIGVILGLTWVIHGDANVAQAQRERSAAMIRSQLSQLAWRASLVLAERGDLAAVADGFQRTSDALLSELRAERVHFEMLADGREKQLSDFRVFTRDLKQAVSDLRSAATGVSTGLDGMADAQAAVAMTVTAMLAMNGRLDVSIGDLAGQLDRSTTTTQAVMERLDRATTELGGSVGRFGPDLDRIAGSSEGLRLEVAGLREALSKERVAYIEAAQVAGEAADGLQRSFDAATRVSADLGEIIRQTDRSSGALATELARVRETTSGLSGLIGSASEASRSLEDSARRLAASADEFGDAATRAASALDAGRPGSSG